MSLPRSPSHVATTFTASASTSRAGFGPEFTFDEAISLLINWADQDEIDYHWTKLTDGGGEVQCGWLKDRYGLSWQVNPTGWTELLHDPDAGRAQRARTAVFGMRKIDIAAVYAAADQA